MMMAEANRLHRMQRNHTLFQWRQEAYRGVNTQIRSFHERFLGSTGPNSIRTQANMDSRTTTVTSASGVASRVNVTAVAGAGGARPGTHNIEVLNVASRQSFTSPPASGGTINNPGATAITAGNAVNPADIRAGESFRIALNSGNAVDITFSQAHVNTLNDAALTEPERREALRDIINTQLYSAFGSGDTEQRVFASMSTDGRLSFNTNRASDNIIITEGLASPPRNVLFGAATNVANFETAIRDAYTAGENLYFRFNVNGTDIDVTLDPEDFLDNNIFDRAAFEEALFGSVNTAIAGAGLGGNIEVGFSSGTGEMWILGSMAIHTALDFSMQQVDAAGNVIAASTLQAEGRLGAITTLGVLGGVTNGDTNTFTATNRIGDIFGANHFTSSYVPATDNSLFVDADGYELRYPGGPRVVQQQLNVTIGDSTITLRGDMTVQQMMNTINQADIGGRISFSPLAGTFTLEATEVGRDGRIVSGVAGLGALGNMLGFNAPNATVVAGEDSRIRFNEAIVVRDTNQFQLEGLNIDLRELSQAMVDAAPNGEYAFTVTVVEDSSRTRDVITSFVEEYNALVQELAELRNTARPRGAGNAIFDPLLDHEREHMSSAEQERWEAQARTGMLHRSELIERTLSDMRRVLTGTRIDIDDSEFSTLSLQHLGITQNRDGTLDINENVLNSGLARFESADVQRLFFDLGANMDETVRTNMRRIENHAGVDGRGALNRETRLERQIDDLNSRIAREEERLTRREQQLFSMFAAMEASIMQSNSQMEFLWSMMGM